mmetsp:Transcript_30903/g.74241  ORF Transcript_30903/g.74241 Transcript_30903/m.74241 type:complete len:726 (-) Transcript_30903:784-2961(-)
MNHSSSRFFDHKTNNQNGLNSGNARLRFSMINLKDVETKGYLILRGILSAEECSSSFDRVWSFYEDISNGAVKRNLPSTWDGAAYPKEGLFEAFGAGWLLGTMREVLAEKIYEPLFSTRELHCSKEGFRIGMVVTQQTETFANQCVKIDQLLFRSIAVVSSGMGTSIDFKIGNGEFEEVRLSHGDVLLYRSDVTVFEKYVFQKEASSFKDLPIVAYNTMAPVTDKQKGKSVLNQKVESYKTRRTGTFNLHDESQVLPLSDAPCRSYFRASPPLVTRRQAELYGLLPYHSDDWEKEMNQAAIRGICFLDGVDKVLPPEIEKVCNAKSVQLTCNDPNVTTGNDKYLGGMSSPCGRYIYGVPGTARRVVRISTKTGKMDCIGPSYNGKFKWLRGVEVPASAMKNDDFPNGCCIALPCNSLSFLKVNPAGGKSEVYTFGESLLQEVCQGIKGWYYHGGNLASNGWIYCIPANAPRVVKLNPSTDEVCAIGPVLKGGQKWYGGLLSLTDGCIYGVPHNATTVLKINPETDEVSLVEGTSGPLPEGKWKWHGGLVAGHKIIGFPNNSDEVLIVDCKKSKVYTIGGSSLLKSGRHRIPQDGRYKWLGGALSMNKRYAYLFPCDAEQVLRVDCHTDELKLVGPSLLDGINKFQNGFCGRDGCLYGIPQRAIGVLRIVPGGAPDGDDHVDLIPCGENMLSVKDKFEGGVLGQDGCIYCIPLKATACVKIIPEQF